MLSGMPTSRDTCWPTKFLPAGMLASRDSCRPTRFLSAVRQGISLANKDLAGQHAGRHEFMLFLMAIMMAIMHGNDS